MTRYDVIFHKEQVDPEDVNYLDTTLIRAANAREALRIGRELVGDRFRGLVALEDD